MKPDGRRSYVHWYRITADGQQFGNTLLRVTKEEWDRWHDATYPIHSMATTDGKRFCSYETLETMAPPIRVG